MEIGPILRAIGRNKARFGLIAVEVALTLAVVVNCIALISDARKQMAQPSGFDDDNLVQVFSTPFDAAFQEDSYAYNSLQEDLVALRAMPGVRSVMPTRFVPWQGGGSSTELKVVGTQGPMLRTQIYSTDEAMLETLGVSLIEGRTFTHEEVVRDSARLKALFASERPRNADGNPRDKYLQEVVISKGWAEHALGEGPYLGRMFEDSDTDQYRVIGVFEPFYNPYAWPIHEYAVFFANMGASYDSGAAYLIRAKPGQVAAVTKGIEGVLTKANPLRTVRVQRITEVRHNFFGPQRMVAWLMGLVAVLLVVVTALGIVGVTSFLVTERTRQIGTRRALGATMPDIVRYFLLENWLVTTFGVVLGVGLAIGLNVALVSGVAGAKLGPITVVAGAVLLWLLGLGSALIPALRAASTSPAVATRSV